MQCRKNLSMMQVKMRVLLGVLLLVLAYPLFAWNWPAWLMLGLGLVSIVTGVLAYCPVCELVLTRKDGEYVDK